MRFYTFLVVLALALSLALSAPIQYRVVRADSDVNSDVFRRGSGFSVPNDGLFTIGPAEDDARVVSTPAANTGIPDQADHDHSSTIETGQTDARTDAERVGIPGQAGGAEETQPLIGTATGGPPRYTPPQRTGTGSGSQETPQGYGPWLSELGTAVTNCLGCGHGE